MIPSENRAIAEHWEAMAAAYDEAKARNAAYERQLQEAIALPLDGAARRRVLDVGCGTGRTLAALQPVAGVGIDQSAAMIEHARKHLAARRELEFRVLDSARVDTLGGGFTAVVSSDLLEHVPDWPAVVRAMARAGTPGGLLVIATPNPLWAPLLWVLEKLRLKMPEGPHRFVGTRAIARALVAAGCRIERVATHALLPIHLGGLGPRLSRAASRLPVLGRLGVIQLVVARAPGAVPAD